MCVVTLFVSQLQTEIYVRSIHLVQSISLCGGDCLCDEG